MQGSGLKAQGLGDSLDVAETNIAILVAWDPRNNLGLNHTGGGHEVQRVFSLKTGSN